MFANCSSICPAHMVLNAPDAHCLLSMIAVPIGVILPFLIISSI